MTSLQVQTDAKRQIIDITDLVQQHIGDAASGVITVFIQHTTAALTVADLDPGTDEDFLDFLTAITPQVRWRHPHDPAHAPDHLLASLIGMSVSLPVTDGKLQLGSWQRIILVELDGPRQRDLVISY